MPRTFLWALLLPKDIQPIRADEVKAERGKNLTNQQVYGIRKEWKLEKQRPIVCRTGPPATPGRLHYGSQRIRAVSIAAATIRRGNTTAKYRRKACSM